MFQTLRIGGLISLSFPQLLMFPTSMELRLYTNKKKTPCFSPKKPNIWLHGMNGASVRKQVSFGPHVPKCEQLHEIFGLFGCRQPLLMLLLMTREFDRKMASSESLEHWAKKSDICIYEIHVPNSRRCMSEKRTHQYFSANAEIYTVSDLDTSRSKPFPLRKLRKCQKLHRTSMPPGSDVCCLLC